MLPGTRAAVMAWLDGNPNSANTLSVATESRLEGTCLWIRERAEIKSWLRPNSDSPNILWLHGHPGFGKTVLCAYLVDFISQTLGETPASYFMNGLLDGEDPYIVLRSWISQLIQDDDAAFALVFSKFNLSPFGKADQSTTRQLLRDILRLKPGCTLVVDGLDECAMLSQNQTSLEKLIRDVRQALADDSRLLIVSRYEKEVQRALGEVDPSKVVELTLTSEDVRSDLAAFSKDIVDRKCHNKPEEVRSDISSRMVEGSGGQFLWLKMQERGIKGWMNHSQLQKKIESTPAELFEVYDRRWKQIQKGPNQERANVLLRWAACSFRPLSVGELTHAAILDPKTGEITNDELPDNMSPEFVESEIEELCIPFLQVHQVSSESDIHRWTVRLAHFTMQEYLMLHLPFQRLDINTKLHRSNEQKHNLLLGAMCLHHVRSPQAWGFSENETTVLRNYAASGWYRHLDKGMLDASDGKTVSLAVKLMNDANPIWKHWREWFDKTQELGPEKNDDPNGKPPDLLYYALRTGIRPVITAIAQKMKKNPQQSTPGRSAFHTACIMGDLATVRSRLDAGTDANLRGWIGRTPMFAAALYGTTEVVRELLKRGADPNMPKWDGSAPLHASVCKGHFETTRLIIEGGSRHNIPNHRKFLPIHEAAWEGRAKIMQLLLETGSMEYLDAVDQRGGTPLHLAVVAGHEDVFNILLEKGADIHIADKAGWRAVHAASGRGRVEIMRSLLRKGADINTPVTSREIREDFDGWTPVHLATYFYQNDILKLLVAEGVLESKATLKARTASRGETPLLLSAMCGHAYAAELFVSGFRAEVNDTDNSGHTALFLASQQGHADVVKVLLNDECVDTNAPDSFGNTPLDAAVRNGHFHVAQLLTTAMGSMLAQHTELRRNCLLQWAKSTQNPDLISLLEQYAGEVLSDASEKEQRISAKDFEHIQFEPKRAWCYACTLCFPKASSIVGYRCGSCDGGYFHLCANCVGNGAQCRDSSHSLEILKERKRWFPE